MLWAKSDRIISQARRVAFSALFSIGFINASFAQSEPPLTVQLAGRLPGPSSGCDAGVAGALYGNASSPAKTGPAHAGNNTTSDLGVPLYSNANAGENIPLFSNPLAGDNVPLYSNPTPGSNRPLYSNSSLSNNDTLGGNTNSGSNASSVGNVGAVTCRSGIPVDGWLLYPSIRLYSIFSDNLFLAPTGTTPIKAPGFGTSPSLTAQWTNGIHTTTIYGNIDRQIYPTDDAINTFDRQATVTQKYAPLPDLTFTALGDYTHKTISSSLTNSIPDQIATPTTTPIRLPNGNIELPNGTIVSPTGQIVGQANPALTANGISVVNPFDQYTATATVTKIFNRAILTLSVSIARTDYDQIQSTGFTSFTTKTFRESGSLWLGPVFYAYSNASFSLHANNAGANPDSSAFRVEEGIGTRLIGLFRGSLYFGYQGSETEGSGTAGGEVYGGKISYYPTLAWTITAAIDETINISSQTTASTQALTIDSPEQIPLSSSTRITHPSLRTQYQISPQWAVLGNLNYSRIEYVDSPRLDNTWQADATLNYEIWRNMTLTWDYQYTNIISNAPGMSAKRNFVMMSANYRF